MIFICTFKIKRIKLKKKKKLKSRTLNSVVIQKKKRKKIFGNERERINEEETLKMSIKYITV